MLIDVLGSMASSVAVGLAMAEMDDMAGGALAGSDGLSRRDAIALDSGAWLVS